MKQLFLTICLSKRKGWTNEIGRVNKEIQTAEARLASLNLKFIDDAVDKETYETMKKQLTSEINILKGRHQTLACVGGKDFMKYLKGACTLLTDLDKRYVEASTEIKSQMLGCIIPEKIRFQENSYATTKLNPILVSILSKNNTLENKKIATLDGDLLGWALLDSNQ